MGSTNFCTGGHQFTDWADFCRRTIDINEQQGVGALGMAPFAIGTCPDCWTTKSYPIPGGDFAAATSSVDTDAPPVIWWDKLAGQYHYHDGDEVGVVCNPESVSALSVLDIPGELAGTIWDAALVQLGNEWGWRSIVFTGEHQPRRLLRTEPLRDSAPRVQKDEVVAELDRLQKLALGGVPA